MWKQKVKAGIMLHALFMTAVFSLLLQFYLHRQTASHRNFTLNRERLQAYAMAVIANKDSRHREFDKGHVQEQQGEKELTLTVTMKTGRHYQFRFPFEKTKLTNDNRDK
ncbi:competence type IV pilus minor pilin ComGG [Streptococcus intermedius]|uniref:competence type IV pilus minor pilin ComGG n=1 Tax=Streptococcus intermedius TaxID=1338 RepID=UPI0022A74F7C|nr:competence type IV pilus minor pilin ComGG [Streptococcus intermedius]